MPAGIVKGHIVVKGGVHTAGAQSIGHSPQTEHPERGRSRKAKQGQCRQSHTESRHPARAQFVGETVAVEAGEDGPRRDNHRDDTRIGNRHPQFSIDGRPGRTQQGIGQSETDKRQIDDAKQKMYHANSS